MNQETAATIGSAIGAGVLVAGDITEFDYAKSSVGGAVSVPGGGGVEVAGQSFGTAGSPSTPLGQASREAVEKIVARMADGLSELAWEGLVVDIRNGVIYLNAGATDGLRPGEVGVPLHCRG